MIGTIETEVAIVGGGPVGLTLAMDLAWRGVAVTVARDCAARGEPPSVKCNHVAARSMELFRRLGVARKLRDAGLPRGLPQRRRLPHDDGRPRADAHPDPLPARPLHRDAAARTPGGRRPSRRTASTRSSSSRSCSSTPRRTPGVTILNRIAVRPAWRRTTDGVTAQRRATSTSARAAQIARALPRRLRRRPFGGAPAIGARLAGDAGGPARAVHLHPRAGAARRC